jgi:drug/metabolite transporter (DMT)-like permease
MLLMATAPIMATIGGWVIFGETLSVQEVAGIALTLGGVGWVVSEPRGADHPVRERVFAIGVALGLAAAAGQAAGVMAARMGLAGDFSPASATLMRALAALAVVWVHALVVGTAARTVRAWADRSALRLLAAGSVVGPYLGVWLSLVAVQRAPVGIASTLMSLPPVFLIGLEYALFGTRVSRRAVAGTLIAFAGVAAIFSG